MNYQYLAVKEPAETKATKEKEEVVRSVYFEQDEILRGIIKLHCPNGFDCDMTYGNGRFWQNLPQPKHKEGFRLLDLFVLSAKHRLPSPNRVGIQKHARIFHSYFLVLERIGKKPSNV